jgi:hypothetical protein
MNGGTSTSSSSNSITVRAVLFGGDAGGELGGGVGGVWLDLGDGDCAGMLGAECRIEAAC